MSSSSSFYSALYARFAALQPDQLLSARLVYPASVGLPRLVAGEKLEDCVVEIPQIRIQSGGSRYGPFSFGDSEFGYQSAVRLAVASAAFLSAKSVFWWLYNPRIKGWIESKKNRLNGAYSINIVLDQLARQRIVGVEGEPFYKSAIRTADALSVCLLLQQRPKDVASAARSALSCALLLDNPGQFAMPFSAAMARSVLGFLTELGTLPADPVSDVVDLCKGGASSASRLESRWKEIARLADSLYAIMAKMPFKADNAYLPYSNSLDEKQATEAVSQGKKITEGEFARVAKLGNLQLQVAGAQEYLEMFYDLAREEKRHEKILQRLSKVTGSLNFDYCGLQPKDYVSYHMMYRDLAPQIRRIIERVGTIKNISDENPYQESGNIDLQVAIQAIASKTNRDDTFVREEDMLKEEAWTILVDSSLSLRGPSRTVKAAAICIAETAKEILDSKTWAIFSFSDSLYCIKDYDEPYDQEIRARIGGIRQEGLSYIPDAIRACRSLALAHSKDRNYIILVSDGVPSGYPGIAEEFSRSVKELAKSGISLAAIGMGSGGITKAIRKSKVVDKPADLVKAFIEIYYSLST